MTTPTHHFCWVKTVLVKPTDTTETIRATRLQEVLQLTAIKPPPPAPGQQMRFTGGDTNPPPTGSNLMALPEAGSPASGAKWTTASFGPGADISATAPVTALAFQPVAGDRAAVVQWRSDNPVWFSDAIAVSLLEHVF